MRRKTEIALLLLVAVIALIILGHVHPPERSATTITGEVATTVNVSGAANTSCNITLRKGANLVSFFCIGDFVPRSDIVQDIEDLGSVRTYKEGEADPWRTYNPNLPNWTVQDLEFFTRRNAYWIVVNSTSTFDRDGVLATTDIALTEGYNFVGYPLNESRPVPDVFDSIDNYTKVVGYDPDSKTFLVHVPNETQELNETRPGRGYWINATKNTTWTVS